VYGIARKMGFDEVALSLSLDSVTATVRYSGHWTTVMRAIGPPGINAWRIAELERLAREVSPGTAPQEIKAKLVDIESAQPLYSRMQVAVAIGLASGSFAFLNGVGLPEMIAAALGGGIAQLVRSWLSHRNLNQFGVAALSAMMASGLYVALAILANGVGFAFTNYPAGFIASVLFLVPGFPLIAALFDLLQYQTVPAISRLAYGVMVLLAVGVGLSVVVEIADIDISRQAPVPLAYPVKLVLRAAASFVAACAFAISFNTAPRTVLAVGCLALAANDLRLALVDSGLMLAPSAFFGALTIGFLAVLLEQRFEVPRMATTVAPTVIMIPGLYAFEMIVLLNRGHVIEAVQAATQLGFAIGGLAMGLAAARFFISPGSAAPN
jgi:uncharacterized membrane protein YjjP (DUF1212 family)